MSHIGNWSDRKRSANASDERAKRIFGWWRAGPSDRWAPVDSPQGLKARGAKLTARCASHDCSRRVRFDADLWIGRGMGAVQLSAVRAAYTCARTPCGLSWQSEIYPLGVPLIGFADEAGAEVTCTCQACKLQKTLSARAFVDWLVSRGVSPNVPAWDLNGTVRGRCPTCGTIRWTVSLRAPGRVITAPAGQAR